MKRSDQREVIKDHKLVDWNMTYHFGWGATDKLHNQSSHGYEPVRLPKQIKTK